MLFFGHSILSLFCFVFPVSSFFYIRILSRTLAGFEIFTIHLFEKRKKKITFNALESSLLEGIQQEIKNSNAELIREIKKTKQKKEKKKPFGTRSLRYLVKINIK